MKSIIQEKFAVLSLLTFAFLFPANAGSQVIEEWVKRYNGPGNGDDGANSIAVDNSGNVYVTGYSLGSGTYEDYCTIKYNSSGVQQWAQRYNGSENTYDYGISIAVDVSGNVYVTGQSVGSGTSHDYCTIKYNFSGVQQWAPRYNGPGNGWDVANSIAVDNWGNVYVTGYSTGSGTYYDYCTIKYNFSGVQQWALRYNGPGNSFDGAYSIAVDNSGNVYVTGYSTGSGTNEDYCTIKYDFSGVQQWVQRYNGPGNAVDRAHSIAVDNSGNVYVTGGSLGSGTYDDYCTIKYNSSGVQQWTQRYNGPGNSSDGANSIAVDNSGNVYVTGPSYGSGTYDDYCTIKYDSSGVQQWVQRYNGPGNADDRANSIAVDNSGNVYVTGSSSGSGMGYYDYCTIKYNTSGVQQWVQRYDGPGNASDEANSIALDSLGNVYVTGRSHDSEIKYDYCTIKYYDLIGVQKTSNEIPKSYELFQNYPNPFNPVTKIKFEIPSTPLSSIGEGTGVRLDIYDILGREVATLVNEQLKSGTYEVEWNASNYPSAVYFCMLETEMFIQTKKMVLLK